MQSTPQAVTPTSSLFKPAEKSKAWLRMGLTGPSGAGKTYTGLLMARAVAGMGGRIALVDTENRRASYYAANDEFRGNDNVTFHTVVIEPDYTVEKYIAAIKDAEAAGFDVLIIDSLTHAWKGEGGLLQQKDVLDRRPGSSSYTNWNSITKQHEALVGCMLNAKLHLIATMRSKQDYILESKDGKSVPVKVGMAPEQRDGMEFEFAIVLAMAMDHSALVDKNITGVLKDRNVFTPKVEHGVEIITWLNEGADADEARAMAVPDQPKMDAGPAGNPRTTEAPRPTSPSNGKPADSNKPTEDQWAEVNRLCNALKTSVTGWAKDQGVKLPLNRDQMATLIQDWKNQEAQQKGGAA